MSAPDFARSVQALLDDDGTCPPSDPPDGRWSTFDMVCPTTGDRGRLPRWAPFGLPLSPGAHRHVPTASERGATAPRHPAPGTAS